MLEDIRSFKELGAEAVVLGALDIQGQVDVAITSQCVLYNHCKVVWLLTLVTGSSTKRYLCKVSFCRAEAVHW